MYCGCHLGEMRWHWWQPYASTACHDHFATVFPQINCSYPTCMLLLPVPHATTTSSRCSLQMLESALTLGDTAI